MPDKTETDRDEGAGQAPETIRAEPMPPAAAPNPIHEALAGALPDWDLLPATVFIRRH